jgi:hypothetical protein
MMSDGHEDAGEGRPAGLVQVHQEVAAIPYCAVLDPGVEDPGAQAEMTSGAMGPRGLDTAAPEGSWVRQVQIARPEACAATYDRVPRRTVVYGTPMCPSGPG